MNALTKKPVFYFISHTHWDREWYLTFEQFRFRLVQLMDRLIELLENDPKFLVFHLDAQTIILEDYLEIRPERREQLERLVRKGRIVTGPWYVQNDLFLTSGESTVRNLIEGIRRARELGGEMKVGYLPDHFGLIGQMPQIFQSVGIDNCVFARGYDHVKHGGPHFTWASPDGSNVLAIFMPHWYNNAQRLPVEPSDLGRVFENMASKEMKANSLPHYLMMNGVDHLEAQENLHDALEWLRGQYGDQYEFKHSTLSNYVNQLQEEILAEQYPCKVLTGELREGPDTSILAGTLSSRLYIKQANMQCHDLLEKWLEPISVWCEMLGLDPYDQDYLRYLWKLYMKNHPHDSICGCSMDAVHEHMMDRYASLQEAGESMLEHKLEILARQIDPIGFSQDDQKLLCVNTSQVAFDEGVTSELYFLETDQVKEFSIEDAAGASVPYRLVSWQKSRIRKLSPINLPISLDCHKATIEWQPQVPALGYSAYAVRPHAKGNIVTSGRMEGRVIENDALKVEFREDGTFSMMDKLNQVHYDRLGEWEEQGDQGNLYTFVPVGASTIFHGKVEFTAIEQNDMYSEIGYCLKWELPAGLNLLTRERKEERVPIEISATFRLESTSKQLTIRVQIRNHAENHRLRLLLHTDEPFVHSWSGAPFDLVQRDPHSGREWNRATNVSPFWKSVAVVTNSSALACYAKGLHEYEVLAEEQKLAITVLRGVHAIHFSQVPLDVDQQIKGQCLGVHNIELALRPFENESLVKIYKEAELFHQGIKQFVLPIDEKKWLHGRPWVQDTSIPSQFMQPDPNASKQRLPMRDPWMRLTGNIVLSALKKSEDGESYIVRLFNPGECTEEITIQFPVRIRQSERTNLIEEVTEVLASRGQMLKSTVKRKKIETLKFIME